MAKFGEAMRGLSVFITDIRNCECYSDVITGDVMMMSLLQVRVKRQRERESTRSWQTFAPNSRVRKNYAHYVMSRHGSYLSR